MKNEEEKIDLKKEGITVDDTVDTQKMRQIIIETDGTSVKLVKAEVAGNIELIGVLQSIIGYISNKK